MIMGVAGFIRRNFFRCVVASVLIGSLARFYFLFRYHETFVTKWILRQFYANYFDYGFAKRALFGTVFYPLLISVGPSQLAGQIFVICYELAVIAIVAIGFDRYCRRHMEGSRELFTWILAAMVLAPFGFMAFADDLGRYDHVNLVLVFAGAMCALRQRYWLAGALLGAATLVHEAAMFFGSGPMLAVLFANRARKRDAIIALAPGALAIAAVTLWGNMSPDELALLASRPGVDTSVWTRGAFTTPVGRPFWWEAIALLFYASMPYVFLYTVVRHNRASLIKVFAPQLIVLGLFPIGYDYFRWSMLAAGSVLITLVVLGQRQDFQMPRYAKWQAALLLLYIAPLGPIGTAHPLIFIELIVKNAIDITHRLAG